MSNAYSVSMWVLATLCVAYVLLQGMSFSEPYIYIASGVFAAGVGVQFDPSDFSENLRIEGFSKFLFLPAVAFLSYGLALLAIGIPAKLICELFGRGV